MRYGRLNIAMETHEEGLLMDSEKWRENELPSRYLFPGKEVV